MMIRLMFVFGFIITLLLGCSSDKQGVQVPVRSLLGADVDLSQAQQYRIVMPVESYPAPEGKPRIKILVYAETAVTFEQRAQTAMKAAIDYADGGAYEVMVWLERDAEQSERVAIADYFPYGKMAFGNASINVWDVRAADPIENRGALAPYFSTKPSSAVPTFH